MRRYSGGLAVFLNRDAVNEARTSWTGQAVDVVALSCGTRELSACTNRSLRLYAVAVYVITLSVCLSVRLSQAGVVSEPLNVSLMYGIFHYLTKLIFVQLKVLHVLLNACHLMILSAISNVICFSFMHCFYYVTTCMFYNYCVRRSTVSVLCALLSCSVAICQMIMLMCLSV